MDIDDRELDYQTRRQRVKKAEEDKKRELDKKKYNNGSSDSGAPSNKKAIDISAPEALPELKNEPDNELDLERSYKEANGTPAAETTTDQTIIVAADRRNATDKAYETKSAASQIKDKSRELLSELGNRENEMKELSENISNLIGDTSKSFLDSYALLKDIHNKS